MIRVESFVVFTNSQFLILYRPFTIPHCNGILQRFIDVNDPNLTKMCILHETTFLNRIINMVHCFYTSILMRSQFYDTNCLLSQLLVTGHPLSDFIIELILLELVEEYFYLD